LFSAIALAFSCSSESNENCSVKPKANSKDGYDVFCDGEKVGELSNSNEIIFKA
jgi:hypothetical protein